MSFKGTTPAVQPPQKSSKTVFVSSRFALPRRYSFDLRDEDVFACVADVGWITGHSYIVYGPLANGATTVMFESVPTYFAAERRSC